MLGRFCARIVHFFIQRKIIFFLLLSVFFAIGLIGINRIKINSNIFDIFPEGQHYKAFSSIMKENDFTKQVIFSVNVQQESAETYDLIEKCIAVLQEEGPYFRDFVISRDVDQQELIGYLQKASIGQLSAEDYAVLADKLGDSTAISAQMDVIKEQLQGPKGVFYSSYFSQDPLGVFGAKMKAFAEQASFSNYVVEDGLLLNKSGTKAFFFATLNCDLTNDKCKNEGAIALERATEKVNKTILNADLEGFGTFLVAVENEKQIRKDTTLTLVISVSLIFIVLFGFYRKIIIPLVFLIPSIFGVVFGLGFVGFVHPEINIISVVTASVLLGIVLDYSFHFFTHLKHTKSIMETVKEVSFPMLVGSFTTVGAFASLLFTSSSILQNFGLIALVTLMGAAVFTIIGLPVILTTFRFAFPEAKVNERNAPKWMPKLLTLIIVIGTIFFLFRNQTMRFDGDLNNLAYHPAHLSDKEKVFTGVDPLEQKKLYLFAKGAEKTEVESRNFQLFTFINAQKEQMQIAEVMSVAPYLIPAPLWDKQSSDWQTFWKEHPRFINQLREISVRKGFNEKAFDPFYALTLDSISIAEEGSELLEALGLKFLIHDNADNQNILTSVLIDKSDVEVFKQKIQTEFGEDVFVMDIADLSAQFLVSLTDDFNYLLLFSSGLVFISLLVIYGRLELSLFAFAPMAISWLWIISCGSFLGLEFNFVNILLVTFIFGLGDDYSIFVTDGLINQSKTGAKSLSSFRQAIILSGITTMIGTGVLIFGKHPAINSIGGLSILGIGMILLITLYVQPYVYSLFVSKRTAKGRGPLTIFTLLASISLFLTFFICCLLSLLFLMILLLLPISKSKKQSKLNYMIYLVAKMFMTAYPFVKVKTLHKELFEKGNPKILVLNHNSFLDILAVLSLSPKVLILVKDWVYKSPIFGPCIRFAGYLYVEDGTGKNLELLKHSIENGYNIAIFPEGTRSNDGKIHRFHKGAFLLAKKVNVPVQPVVLVGFDIVNPKNDIMINSGEMYIKFLPVQYPNDFETYQTMTKEIQKIMRSSLQVSLLEDTQPRFWKHIVLRNYLLKGPVLEWYMRVKYRMEAENYLFYNRLIGGRKRIYDIGSGLGYLSLLLHYADNEREITAIDADEEKVSIAANAIYIKEKVQFTCSRLEAYHYSPADVFIVNDVLHYLNKEEQRVVLQKLIDLLLPGGLLILRDGIIEHPKLKQTKWTEILSTRVFGFNKVNNEMEFISKDEMEALALDNHLVMDDVSHSQKTSNHLFVFYKK